jgi:adenylate cyclase
MRFYLKMEWDKAIEKLMQAQELEPYTFARTTPSSVIMNRCRNYKENPPVPPGQKWDGVHRLTKK